MCLCVYIIHWMNYTLFYIVLRQYDTCLNLIFAFVFNRRSMSCDVHTLASNNQFSWFFAYAPTKFFTYIYILKFTKSKTNGDKVLLLLMLMNMILLLLLLLLPMSPATRFRCWFAYYALLYSKRFCFCFCFFVCQLYIILFTHQMYTILYIFELIL